MEDLGMNEVGQVLNYSSIHWCDEVIPSMKFDVVSVICFPLSNKGCWLWIASTAKCITWIYRVNLIW